MHKLRLILLILFITCAACDVNKSDAAKAVEATTTSVKLTKIEETKSKTEKRDSSDQTGSYLEKAKDEPFRPIYRPHYHESPNFRPTTVRYVAAEATPQAYYEKGELMGGIQYANPGGGGSSHNAAGVGGHFASSAYRLLPQQQSHATQMAHAHLPQQVKISTAAVPPPSAQYYAYAEPEMNYMHERLPLHQPHRMPLPLPQHQQQQQQHQIQYVIAIPLSYVRQLQQQLAGIPTHASQAYALPAAGLAYQAPAPLPHPMMLQAIGSLTRDHQGTYRPYHQHYAAAASNGDTEAAPPAPPGYTTQYLQIPAGVLLAAAQAATRQQRPPHYQQLYYMPQHHAQPTYQQHYQQPQQLQPLYAHYVQQQSAPLQQPQQQHQLKQQQQQPTVVRIGGLKPSDKLSPPHISSSATPAATGATASPPRHSAAPSPSPIVHYNPYYVQAPPPPQEQQQQQPSFIGNYNYARYDQDQHGSTAAHPLIRLSSPSALIAPHAATHYNYHPMSAPLNYAVPAPPSYATHQNGGAISMTPLPYFYHPGGIHYGTHLYHPPTPTTPSKILEAPAGNQQQHQQQQQQQQPHQQQLQQQYQPHATSSSTATTITNGAAASVAPTVVKYP